MAPSLAVGVQAHRRLAVGLLLEDAMALSLAPCPASLDPSAAPSCSSPQVVSRSLMNPVVQLGLLASLGLGSTRSMVLLAASVRSAPNLGLAPILDSYPRTNLPWIVRAGARYLHRDRFSGRPIFDIELDGTAQLWTPDDLQYMPSVGPLVHNSLGLRLGGSYHVALPHATLIGRLGFLFDDALPRPDLMIAGFGQVMVDYEQYYDFYGTIGVGVQTRRLDVNVGYGYGGQLFHRGPISSYGGGFSESHLMSLGLLVHLD
jgi:hypothetical protein